MRPTCFSVGSAQTLEKASDSMGLGVWARRESNPEPMD